MSKIRLSIIIPVYNSGKYLEKCISSIKRNKCEEYEIIIIDDRMTGHLKFVINIVMNFR